jgi:hypothetical protein
VPVDRLRPVSEHDHSWHVRRAHRVLVDLGIELAAEAVTTFVVRLLHGHDAGLDDDENVARAAEQLDDGPIGFLATEPLLGRTTLTIPATTAEDAADQTVRLFAREVLDRQRRDPVVPGPEPSRTELARRRGEHRARRALIRDDLRARLAVETARLRSPRWSDRAGAASYLGRHAVVEAREAIVGLLDDPYPEVAEAAADALRALPPTAAGDPPPVPPTIPDFGERYAAMDVADAADYVLRHFEPLTMDLRTFTVEYRDPADGSTWVVDHPDADRPGGGRPRVRRIG